MRAMATAEDRDTADSVGAWRKRTYDSVAERSDELFTSISGVESELLYTPESVELEYARDLGYPGEYPYTRGVYPSMYR